MAEQEHTIGNLICAESVSGPWRLEGKFLESQSQVGKSSYRVVMIN